MENSNQKYYKEAIPKGREDPISAEQTEVILDQMKKSLCKIYMVDEGFGSGFFCKIPFFDEFNTLPVLFTNNHVLGENDIKIGHSIIFSLEDDKIKKRIIIDDTRKTYTSEDLDTTIVEIKKSDKINSFLEIDEKLFNSSTEKNYCEGKQIYILQYPKGKKCSFSTGIIKTIHGNDINHSCPTKKGSSGGAILNLLNFKVVGIHKGKTDYNYNKGTLIKTSIKEFIDKFKKNNLNYINQIKSEKIEETGNVNIVENEKNEILIKMKIDENEINHQINLLGFNEALNYFQIHFINGNHNETVKEEYNHLIEDIEKQFFELYDNNVILYIDDKKDEFTPYFIPKNSGTFTIKLIFKIKLENCAGLFWECKNLIDINLSNFKTKNVKNMYGMFYGCNNLTNVNLSNFNTENVMNMESMFNGCSGLKSLDLKSFNTEKVTNMNNMFHGCSKLVTLDLISFNTQNVINLSCMFSGCSYLKIVDLSKIRAANVFNIAETQIKKNSENEIVLKINIEKNDVMNTVYFLDNPQKEDGSDYENHLFEINESNTTLIIEGEITPFSKSFIPKKAGIHTIKLIFNNKISNCKYIFFRCFKISEIDFSKFNQRMLLICSICFIIVQP